MQRALKAKTFTPNLARRASQGSVSNLHPGPSSLETCKERSGCLSQRCAPGASRRGVGGGWALKAVLQSTQIPCNPDSTLSTLGPGPLIMHTCTPTPRGSQPLLQLLLPLSPPGLKPPALGRGWRSPGKGERGAGEGGVRGATEARLAGHEHTPWRPLPAL